MYVTFFYFSFSLELLSFKCLPVYIFFVFSTFLSWMIKKGKLGVLGVNNHFLRTFPQRGGGGVKPLSATKEVFFFLKEKKNVLERKNMHLKDFKLFKFFPLKIIRFRPF